MSPVSPVNTAAAPQDQLDQAEELGVEELLVEEVSIDGMCGVY